MTVFSFLHFFPQLMICYMYPLPLFSFVSSSAHTSPLSLQGLYVCASYQAVDFRFLSQPSDCKPQGQIPVRFATEGLGCSLSLLFHSVEPKLWRFTPELIQPPTFLSPVTSIWPSGSSLILFKVNSSCVVILSLRSSPAHKASPMSPCLVVTSVSGQMPSELISPSFSFQFFKVLW